MTSAWSPARHAQEIVKNVSVAAMGTTKMLMILHAKSALEGVKNVLVPHFALCVIQISQT